MAFKKFVKKLKKNFSFKELTLPEAKVLAMLTVIYADEKTDMHREMGLLKAFCVFDSSLIDIDIATYIEHFNQYKENRDSLFKKLAESIHDRDEKMDLLSSAYLLASIDGSISKAEKQILHRLGNTLRMSLEDINTVEEHSEFITRTLNESHRIDKIPSAASSANLSPGEAKVLAILAVIYADEKQEVERELSILEAMFSFDREGNEVDLASIQAQFQEYQSNPGSLFEAFSNLEMEHEKRTELLSSAYVIADIDGQTSPQETAVLERLASAFRLNQEDTQKAQAHSQTLISTMKELRLLS